MDTERRKDLELKIFQLHAAGLVGEHFFDGSRFQVRGIGPLEGLESLRHIPEVTLTQPNQQAYYFLADVRDELRPGSGIIRNSGGRSEGPGGTLTCLLSSIDGRHNYFVGAGHVLSDFWNKKEDPAAGDKLRNDPIASIYRYRKGFPATNSTHFLGKLRYLSRKPRTVNAPSGEGRRSVKVDIGIVKIASSEEEVALKQRTTCFGNFGELPCDQVMKVEMGQRVMKCGAEESHWTFAVVEEPCRQVTVYGPDGVLYELSEQVILSSSAPFEPLQSTDPPPDWSAKRCRPRETPFAVPGDSGTMIVDASSRRPLGMLVAGSILDGRYVMTPIEPLQNFWADKGLIFRRA
jgi:hypothetical protein